jgi:hypothetical protein
MSVRIAPNSWGALPSDILELFWSSRFGVGTSAVADRMPHDVQLLHKGLAFSFVGYRIDGVGGVRLCRIVGSVWRFIDGCGLAPRCRERGPFASSRLAQRFFRRCTSVAVCVPCTSTLPAVATRAGLLEPSAGG